MRGVCRVHPKGPAGPRRWRRIMFPEVPPGNTIEDLSGAKPKDPHQTQLDSGWAGHAGFRQCSGECTVSRTQPLQCPPACVPSHPPPLSWLSLDPLPEACGRGSKGDEGR